MPGTKAGSVKAVSIIIDKYGNDYFKQIGANGGRKSKGGGFSSNPEKAGPAGHKGGIKSGEVRRAKRDNYLTPLLDAGWRYQDRDLLPPTKLNTSKAAYFDKRREGLHRDTNWDKANGLKPYGSKKKTVDIEA